MEYIWHCPLWCTSVGHFSKALPALSRHKLWKCCPQCSIKRSEIRNNGRAEVFRKCFPTLSVLQNWNLQDSLQKWLRHFNSSLSIFKGNTWLQTLGISLVMLRLRHGKRVRKTSDVFGERRQLDYGQKKRRKKCGTPGEASNKNRAEKKHKTTTQAEIGAQVGGKFFVFWKGRMQYQQSYFFESPFFGNQMFLKSFCFDIFRVGSVATCSGLTLQVSLAAHGLGKA